VLASSDLLVVDFLGDAVLDDDASAFSFSFPLPFALGVGMDGGAAATESSASDTDGLNDAMIDSSDRVP
jgi:hypothetical protein